MLSKSPQICKDSDIRKWGRWWRKEAHALFKILGCLFSISTPSEVFLNLLNSIWCFGPQLTLGILNVWVHVFLFFVNIKLSLCLIQFTAASASQGFLPKDRVGRMDGVRIWAFKLGLLRPIIFFIHVTHKKPNTFTIKNSLLLVQFCIDIVNNVSIRYKYHIIEVRPAIITLLYGSIINLHGVTITPRNFFAQMRNINNRGKEGSFWCLHHVCQQENTIDDIGKETARPTVTYYMWCDDTCNTTDYEDKKQSDCMNSTKLMPFIFQIPFITSINTNIIKQILTATTQSQW